MVEKGARAVHVKVIPHGHAVNEPHAPDKVGLALCGKDVELVQFAHGVPEPQLDVVQ